MIQCEGQLSFMDLLTATTNDFKPGDWIEKRMSVSSLPLTRSRRW